MAELTAEIVRTIIKEEFTGIHGEFAGVHEDINGIRKDIAGIRGKIDGVQEDVAELRQDLHANYATRDEIMDAIGQVLEAVQSLSDEDRDQLAGVKGRLHNHNERIAHLERLNHLR